MEKEANGILSEYLMSKTYDPRQTEKWCQDLTESLLQKVSEGWYGVWRGGSCVAFCPAGGEEEKYKFVVHLVICEERGCGWR